LLFSLRNLLKQIFHYYNLFLKIFQQKYDYPFFPSISQSGTESHTGHMVKHESGHLRYFLMNATDYVFMHESIFTEFYYKKCSEGKSHRVALTHVAKKLVRIIYKLESENITFNSNIN